jgi:hypothetical protein
MRANPTTRNGTKEIIAMTRYDELAKLAADSSRRIFAYKGECERFAFKLMKGLKEYLGAPDGTMKHVHIDRRFPRREMT